MPTRSYWFTLVSLLLILLLAAPSSGAQDATSEATTEVTAEATSLPTPESTTEATSEPTPEMTTEATVEATTNPTAEVTLEATTEVAPNQPPSFNLTETTYAAVPGEPLALKFTVSDDGGMVRVVAQGDVNPEWAQVEMVAPGESAAPFNTGVTLIYQPAADFAGTENITLTAIDSVGGTTAVTLTMMVGSAEATPEATVEAQEDSLQAARTYVVNSTGDGNDANTADGICQTSTPNECTLRAAIEQANTNVGADTINFNIPGAGVQTIQPATNLPTITETVTINGYSQPGAAPATTNAAATLLIVLRDTFSADIGLRTVANNCLIKGLVVENFTDVGIFISSASGNRIEGNYIGADQTGTSGSGNVNYGVFIENASNNIIGGVTPAARNLISGNVNHGIGVVGASASSNRIEGNYIGTDVTGTLNLGNGQHGIRIVDAPNNLIGGTSAGARNLISGNGGSGIFITGASASGNKIQGNYIGTRADGNADIGNGSHGISASDASNLIIGGTTAGARNLISGNDSNGIDIGYGVGNRIEGNYIGTNAAGTDPLSNSGSGISTFSTANMVVGGTSPGARNLISANAGDGIFISGFIGINNRIEGNYIGTNAAGTGILGNSGNGVYLYNNAAFTVVGGTSTGSRNVISGNSAGILIEGISNRVQGNYIGTDATGKIDLGNNNSGILIQGDTNIIGGTTAGARNIISGNNGTGISITSSGNLISGNYIGTTADGKGALGNSGNGISLGGGVAANNVIGGTAAGAANVIAYNALDGINLGFTAPGLNTRLLNNQINNNGGVGIDLDVSGAGGVTLNDDDDPDIGPNNGQNFPVIDDVVSSGGVRILGTLDTNPGVYRLEFFANPTCDPSGYGEGQQFIGRVTLETDENGDLQFDVTLKGKVAAGSFVTATATDANGNTSEFSACRALSTVKVPGKPALTSPRNRSNIADTTPTYTWRAITGITDYQIEIALDSNFILIVDSAAVSAPTYDSAALTLGETYYVRVRAFNSEGIPGAWSTVNSFSVVP